MFRKERKKRPVTVYFQGRVLTCETAFFPNSCHESLSSPPNLQQVSTKVYNERQRNIKRERFCSLTPFLSMFSSKLTFVYHTFLFSLQWTNSFGYESLVLWLPCCFQEAKEMQGKGRAKKNFWFVVSAMTNGMRPRFQVRSSNTVGLRIWPLKFKHSM